VEKTQKRDLNKNRKKRLLHLWFATHYWLQNLQKKFI